MTNIGSRAWPNTFRPAIEGWNASPAFGPKELHGPEDLVEAVFHCREIASEIRDWFAPVSEKAVKKLLAFAYQASLRTDEGRYPCFTITLCQEDHFPFIARFRHPIPLHDAAQLVPLAPAARFPECSLLVREEGVSEKPLVLLGIIAADERGFDSQVGRPEVVGVGAARHVSVVVEGPGIVRVQDCMTHLRLAGGSIQHITDWYGVPAYRAWLGDLGTNVVEQCVAAHGPSAEKWFGGSWGVQTLIHSLWSQVLRATVRRAHGGAFLILPHALSGPVEPFLERHGIDARHVVRDCDLTAQVGTFWRHCGEMQLKVMPDSSDAQEWRVLRHQLWTKVRGVAALAEVDGCVVFDRHLSLCAFGAFLRPQPSALPIRDARTNEVLSEEVLMKFGTRHQSAVGFCRSFPGSIAFVVSQDAVVRVFHSDSSGTYGFGPLYADARRITDVS